MQSSTAKSARHALDLRPTHVRQQHSSPTKTKRRTIANSTHCFASSSFAVYTGNRNQRCIVKISYTRNSKTRSWAAHREYLQREHAQNTQEKGQGFNHESNSVDLKTTLRQWQRDEDEHVFKRFCRKLSFSLSQILNRFSLGEATLLMHKTAQIQRNFLH